MTLSLLPRQLADEPASRRLAACAAALRAALRTRTHSQPGETAS